ncbi:DNA polymerase Y family protein [Brachybacterium hainanense]|uniref:DNA polymerase Y family protein n=1 Tax=Brachybacterium hainanense TaxID=1541174 RepID=A0ABV6RC50_9MICO
MPVPEQRTPPATRTAAVLVPHWRLLSALDRHRGPQPAQQRTGRDATQETAVPSAAASPMVLVERHRVIRADAAAAAAGVVLGMRRRAAQAACPGMLVLEADREHESALFEVVAAATDTVAAGVDVLRPGVLLMAARGPARHRGGEPQLAESILDAVADLTGWEARVGIADGPFAALLAARSGRIIRPGRSAEYLAPHDIATLRHAPVGPGWGHRDRPGPTGADRLDLTEVVDLLLRLGIATLGDLAALPAASVQDRFGADVALLQLLARGGEPTPPAMHRPEQPIEVLRVLETPLVRSDQAAFAARPMADELHGMLVARGLICTRLRIIGRTEQGEELERTWRHDGELTPADVVDRVRWQCEGWLATAQRRGQETGAITQLLLQPLQLMPAGEGAAALWGSAGEADLRAGRAFARIQGLAGEEAVQVPVPVGGRLLAEQTRLVPWRAQKPVPRPGPWDGGLLRPAPATVFRRPPSVLLEDASGRPVRVDARGLLSALPARLLVPAAEAGALADHGLPTGARRPVRAHGAPVLLDERWWGGDGRRAARIQLVIGADPPGATDPEGTDMALLLLSRGDSWQVEGIYD